MHHATLTSLCYAISIPFDGGIGRHMSPKSITLDIGVLFFFVPDQLGVSSVPGPDQTKNLDSRKKEGNLSRVPQLARLSSNPTGRPAWFITKKTSFLVFSPMARESTMTGPEGDPYHGKLPIPPFLNLESKTKRAIAVPREVGSHLPFQLPALLLL